MATSQTKPHFEVVEEAPQPSPQASQQARADHQAAVKMLMLAISALGQRTLIALSDLFCLLTVGSAFWLFISIENPNAYQLVQLGGYCLFVLAANWIVRRRA